VFAKDIILHIISRLTVNGATDHILEFRGPVVDAMDMSSRMTLCNMAVEAGATSGICLPDKVTAQYLWPFIRENYDSVDAAIADFRKWHSDPDAVYEQTLTFDISNLEPQVTYGFKPDHVKGIKEMAGTRVDQVYIGSCTNGRIEDIRAAASILKGRKIADSVRGILTPATPAIYSQALDEGLIKIFMDSGFCVLNPTCGACLGMSSGVLAEGEVCASTTNRNFNGRMGKGGMVHLMSPLTAAAAAITGELTDPRQFLN
jgi:3-isopropylmalate/(R)-2-methylmalate dehydratase large subunit